LEKSFSFREGTLDISAYQQALNQDSVHLEEEPLLKVF